MIFQDEDTTPVADEDAVADEPVTTTDEPAADEGSEGEVEAPAEGGEEAVEGEETPAE